MEQKENIFVQRTKFSDNNFNPGNETHVYLLRENVSTTQFNFLLNHFLQYLDMRN